MLELQGRFQREVSRITSKTNLQRQRDSEDIEFTQPMKKAIHYKATHYWAFL